MKANCRADGSYCIVTGDGRNLPRTH